MSNQYEKVDLEDFAELDEMGQFDYTGYTSISRGDALSAVLGIEEHEIDVVNHGSYQGTLLYMFETGDYLWLLKDAYGSCSYCDGWIGSEDQDSHEKYVLSMLRNGYAFESVENALTFLEDKAENGRSYGWGGVAPDAIETLK